jgi:hypothetical protein
MAVFLTTLAWYSRPPGANGWSLRLKTDDPFISFRVAVITAVRPPPDRPRRTRSSRLRSWPLYTLNGFFVKTRWEFERKSLRVAIRETTGKIRMGRLP